MGGSADRLPSLRRRCGAKATFHDLPPKIRIKRQIARRAALHALPIAAVIRAVGSLASFAQGDVEDALQEEMHRLLVQSTQAAAPELGSRSAPARLVYCQLSGTSPTCSALDATAEFDPLRKSVGGFLYCRAHRSCFAEGPAASRASIRPAGRPGASYRGIGQGRAAGGKTALSR